MIQAAIFEGVIELVCVQIKPKLNNAMTIHEWTALQEDMWEAFQRKLAPFFIGPKQRIEYDRIEFVQCRLEDLMARLDVWAGPDRTVGVIVCSCADNGFGEVSEIIHEWNVRSHIGIKAKIAWSSASDMYDSCRDSTSLAAFTGQDVFRDDEAPVTMTNSAPLTTYAAPVTIQSPQIQIIEKIVEVPQVQIIEKIVEVPQIQNVEKIVEVPQMLEEKASHRRHARPRTEPLHLSEAVKRQLLPERPRGEPLHLSEAHKKQLLPELPKAALPPLSPPQSPKKAER